MFEKIKMYPYRRNGKNASPDKRSFFRSSPAKKHYFYPGLGLHKSAWISALCLGGAGFFMGRAVLLGELLPFGIAFAAAALHVFGRLGLLALPAVLIGLITVSDGMTLTGSILALLGASLLMIVVPYEQRKPLLFLPGLVLAVIIIVKIPLLVLSNPEAVSYYYFSLLFEAVFAALLTFVAIKALRALESKDKKGKVFSSEEVFCLLLLLGGLIAGAGDLGGELASVKGVLSRLVILLAAFMGGAGAGAAAGAVLGVIPGLAYAVLPQLAPAYSFAGFIAGLCRGFGRAGVTTGFLFANIILTVYVTGYGNIITTLVETGLATVLFLLLPPKLVNEASLAMGLGVEDKKESVGKDLLVEAFSAKVKNWALVFRELSLTFEQLAPSAGSREEERIQQLVGQVGQVACADCSYYRGCWERDFYRTYQSVMDLFARLESCGKITREDLPVEMKKRCSRTKELLVAIICLYETYRANRYWAGRLFESRSIVVEQLKGIGEVIAGLPEELELDVASDDAGPYLRQGLKKAGVKVDSLTKQELKENRQEVRLVHPSCGARGQCRSVIAPLLSQALGANFSPALTACAVSDGESNCHLQFSSNLQYRLALGVAGIGKGGSVVSGDNYAFFHLKGGRLGLALSDGMGVGPRAAMESGATLTLLRHLLELGFEPELAIKTVNSILVLRSPGESFATVDLAVIDLYGGQVEFIKIGAVASFLLRDGEVSQITAKSLPVGIIEDFEVVTQSGSLRQGDVLVMLTDGALEACATRREDEEWVMRVLEDAGAMPPQELADLLLRLAQTGAGGPAGVTDDMTVMVVKLEKQNIPVRK